MGKCLQDLSMEKTSDWGCLVTRDIQAKIALDIFFFFFFFFCHSEMLVLLDSVVFPCLFKLQTPGSWRRWGIFQRIDMASRNSPEPGPE